MRKERFKARLLTILRNRFGDALFITALALKFDNRATSLLSTNNYIFSEI